MKTTLGKAIAASTLIYCEGFEVDLDVDDRLKNLILLVQASEFGCHSTWVFNDQKIVIDENGDSTVVCHGGERVTIEFRVLHPLVSFDLEPKAQT